MFTHRSRHKDIQYTRLSGATKGSDDDSEETELFTRKTHFKEIATEEKTIQEGDTLQAIALRYHCPIAELKRLNNIHKENEIYARNTIKVPARPFTTILAGIHISGKSSPDVQEATEPNVIDRNTLTHKLNTLNTYEQDACNATDFNAVIFNSSIRTCDTSTADGLMDGDHSVCASEEEVNLIPSASHNQLEAELVVSKIACRGDATDISWIALIVCIVIVIFAIPLIYVFYIAEHPEEYHHNSHANLT